MLHTAVENTMPRVADITIQDILENDALLRKGGPEQKARFPCDCHAETTQ